MTAKTFRDLGVHDALCDALDEQGITHPFPIQELALPLALDGNDLIGQARTGTGKTLAFGLPLLQRLDREQSVTQALVVVPTRELCVQVHDDLSVGERLGISTISVYGGVAYDEQTAALTSGVHVVVGTPGRLLDHLQRGSLDLSQVRTLVLDEADEMLDMGFLPDVERLIQACNTERHSMLFSATMPTEVVKLARRYLVHPTFTRADTEQHETDPNVAQHFLSVHRMDKPRVLARILQAPERGGAFVFVRTKMMADRLVDELEGLGVPAVAVHGDLRQQTRERNLDRFRDGRADVLACTEVAARGLDVENVTHVINYDCPDDEKMYLHRIGRTARAGAAGVAVTFAEFNEADRLNVIRKAVGATDTDVKQVFSTSDELTRLFDLPAERPWDHLGEGKGGHGAQRRSTGQQARRGRTDGRPKGRRSAEGRSPSARRDEAPAREAGPGRDRSPRESGGREPARRASGDREEAGGAPTRTRTRTRTRATAAPADSGQQGRRQAAGSRGRQREEDDGSARPGAASGRGAERDGQDRREPAGGRRRARRERAPSSGGRSSGASGTKDARGRGSRGHDDAPATTRAAAEPEGRPARGEGQPQLARRVRVDHLP